MPVFQISALYLQRELAAFMAGVNPGVRLTPIQMREIVEQVLPHLILSTWNGLKALRIYMTAHTLHAACWTAATQWQLEDHKSHMQALTAGTTSVAHTPS